MKLEEIKRNAAIAGIEPGQVVRVVTTEPVGDNAITVYYKTANGQLHERMLFRPMKPTYHWRKRGVHGRSMHQALTSNWSPKPTESM